MLHLFSADGRYHGTAPVSDAAQHQDDGKLLFLLFGEDQADQLKEVERELKEAAAR